ncbi:11033_t:CDS:1 [Cetraspora pellucida]|uniref:11033_t:CDS:1 n=1 Tax=Cetraspora pellucida TaxID=1433469 RepID=A0ACA9MC98_9GLOM|nr:11033_t:CDS:1 [Cetraspora pellucida]
MSQGGHFGSQVTRYEPVPFELPDSQSSTTTTTTTIYRGTGTPTTTTTTVRETGTPTVRETGTPTVRETGTPTTTSTTTTAHEYFGGQDIRSTPTTTSTFTTHEYLGSPGGTHVIRTVRDASGEVTEQHTQEFQGEPQSDVHAHTSRTEETHRIPGGTETIITTETIETETETEYEESSQTQTFSHTKTNK